MGHRAIKASYVCLDVTALFRVIAQDTPNTREASARQRAPPRRSLGTLTRLIGAIQGCCLFSVWCVRG